MCFDSNCVQQRQNVKNITAYYLSDLKDILWGDLENILLYQILNIEWCNHLYSVWNMQMFYSIFFLHIKSEIYLLKIKILMLALEIWPLSILKTVHLIMKYKFGIYFSFLNLCRCLYFHRKNTKGKNVIFI